MHATTARSDLNGFRTVDPLKGPVRDQRTPCGANRMSGLKVGLSLVAWLIAASWLDFAHIVHIDLKQVVAGAIFVMGSTLVLTMLPTQLNGSCCRSQNHAGRDQSAHDA